jgi:hypothetical protein
MRVCGVGDNVVDRYFNQKLMFPGGNAVNFAVHARRSGAHAAYLGVIGTDADGDLIRSSLQAEGIELERLRVEEGPNAFATVHTDDNGNDRRWGLCEKGVSMFRLDSADLDYLARFDLVHTGETSRLDSQLPEIRERAAISFDFSERNLEYAAGVLPYLRAAAFSRGNAGDDEVARVLDAAQSAGVELGSGSVRSGRAHAVAAGRPIREGEILQLCYCGRPFFGHGICFDRPLKVGSTSLPADVRKIVDVAREAQEAALAKVRAGVTTGEVHAAAEKFV